MAAAVDRPNPNGARGTILAGGIALVAGALAFLGVFSYLAARFHYPEVLDGAAADVLPALRATGATGRAAWALNRVPAREIRALRGGRTEGRPVATGRVTPEQALEFGVLLSAVSFALLASAVNVLTAVLALVGGLFYVLVHTRWPQHSTPQNIVIGGAAGAVSPLVGLAAPPGSLAPPAP